MGMLLWENNERRSGVMKLGHRYHHQVDYFPIKAHPEVDYSSHTTAVCQRLTLRKKKKRSTFYPFIATFDIVQSMVDPLGYRLCYSAKTLS